MTAKQWAARQREEASLPVLDRRIAFLPLRARTRHCLERMVRGTGPCSRDMHGRLPDWRPPTPALTYVRDLVRWTEGDLLRLRHFGRTSLEEVRRLLDAHGLR